jgi:glycosyltransferase involved in cell wall biosynthesis
MNHKITVIVPVYNVKNYLTKCSESILNQTYQNLDLILVDDGSTDGSEVICDSFKVKDDRVTVIHQRNSGVSAARNIGLAAAGGDFILFADSDDYLEPDMLNNLICLSEGSDIVICNFYLDYVNRSELFYKEDLNKVYNRIEALKELLGGGNRPVFLGHLWHKLFCRRLLESITFDSRFALYEDALFVIKAFLQAKTIRYTSYAGYHYVQRCNSIMYSGFSQKTYSSVSAAAEIYSVICTDLPLLSTEAQLLYLNANLRQAALCVYSKASYLTLKEIQKNLRSESAGGINLRRLSLKNRIYFHLLVRNKGMFILFYRILIEPQRRRYDRKVRNELYLA